MTQFRKKPIVVDAIQVPTAGEEVPESFWDWCAEHDISPESDRDEGLTVETLQGPAHAKPGDWLCAQRINGKLDVWPCNADIFALTYEPATRQSPPGDGEAPSNEELYEQISQHLPMHGKGEHHSLIALRLLLNRATPSVACVPKEGKPVIPREAVWRELEWWNVRSDVRGWGTVGFRSEEAATAYAESKKPYNYDVRVEHYHTYEVRADAISVAPETDPRTPAPR